MCVWSTGRYSTSAVGFPSPLSTHLEPLPYATQLSAAGAGEEVAVVVVLERRTGIGRPFWYWRVTRTLLLPLLVLCKGLAEVGEDGFDDAADAVVELSRSRRAAAAVACWAAWVI